MVGAALCTVDGNSFLHSTCNLIDVESEWNIVTWVEFAVHGVEVLVDGVAMTGMDITDREANQRMVREMVAECKLIAGVLTNTHHVGHKSFVLMLFRLLRRTATVQPWMCAAQKGVQRMISVRCTRSNDRLGAALGEDTLAIEGGTDGRSKSG
jgi:hypothetical protein